METLAYIHLVTAYEQPAGNQLVEPLELKLLTKLKLKTLATSAGKRLLSVALFISILSVAGNAMALQRGNRGANVVNLQDVLKVAGYFPGNVRSTGYYGSITENAVKQFQRAKGLVVDGIAGSKTMAAISATDFSTPLVGNGTLRRGSRGSQVTALQRHLRALGFYDGPVTGYYGKLTTAAVQRFQRARNLSADGIVGVQTASALITSDDVAVIVNSSNLRRGSSGPEVTNLQNELKLLGYYNGPVTGYYGSLTEAAVRKFQKDIGITVDGVAGELTKTAVYS
ncbi:MAG: peptidoglycan-binding protein [Symploca sp. SIO1C4]|uniref:Peptidoglycan-binding protein n=1 Tax=Symploca sp. SIO1C4 TaxID=2607765 RepID=A0A6B3N8A3_9CYAN|nr:peptidoglycan-binding protein [Symploca sp. SIO1C4]